MTPKGRGVRGGRLGDGGGGLGELLSAPLSAWVSGVKDWGVARGKGAETGKSTPRTLDSDSTTRSLVVDLNNPRTYDERRRRQKQR